MVAGLGGVESGKLEVFNRVPLLRIGQPEEAASVWAFLLSDEAKYSRSSSAPKMHIWASSENVRELSGLPCFKYIFHEFICYLERALADWRTSSVTGSVYTIDGGMLA